MKNKNLQEPWHKGCDEENSNNNINIMIYTRDREDAHERKKNTKFTYIILIKYSEH